MASSTESSRVFIRSRDLYSITFLARAFSLITILCGIPMSSHSLNLAPGRTSSRSSIIASQPFSKKIVYNSSALSATYFDLPAFIGIITSSNGATLLGHMIPD